MNYFPPEELEQVERVEHAAWLRLAEARDRYRMGDGIVPPEEHALLHKLIDEWRGAIERIHAARQRHAERQRHGG